MRGLALVAGFALVALAFAAATRVADTREGLVAEFITLLAGMAGVLLLIYGLTARRRAGVPGPGPKAESRVSRQQPQPRSKRDLALGAGGIALAIALASGLAASGGFWWAFAGALLLLPMFSGSLYLCWRYLRASP